MIYHLLFNLFTFSPFYLFIYKKEATSAKSDSESGFFIVTGQTWAADGMSPFPRACIIW